MSASNGLTPKQEMFCQEYLVDHNGTQAAIRAGYATSGAGVEASRLLKKANIKNRVEELVTLKRQRLAATADFVVGTLQELAADPAVSASVRKGCLEALGKHLGLMTEKFDHTSAGEKIGGGVVFYLPDNGRNPVEAVQDRMMAEPPKASNGNGKH